MMVFWLIIWKYLGLKMDLYDEREFLNIIEYFYIFYVFYCFIRLYIIFVKIFIVEVLKII